MAKNRFTEADLKNFKVVGGAGHKAAAKPAPKKNKFGAIKVPDPETGEMIDSTQEGKDRAMFRQKLLTGEIVLYAKQPEVIVSDIDPDNPPTSREVVKYRADHLVIRIVDGVPVVEIYDTKGKETPDFINKWKQVLPKFPWFKWIKLFGGKPQPSRPKPVKPTKRST